MSLNAIDVDDKILRAKCLVACITKIHERHPTSSSETSALETDAGMSTVPIKRKL